MLGRRVRHDVDLPGRASITVSTIEPNKTIGASPEAEKKFVDDALGSFGSETSSFVRALKRVSRAIAVLPSLFVSSRDHRVQKLVVGAALVACVLLGLVMVGRMLGGSETVSTPAVSATSLAGEQASVVVDSVPSNGGDAKDRLSPVQATAAARARDGRSSAADERPPNGSNQSAIATRTPARPSVRRAAPPNVGSTDAPPTPEPSIANDEAAVLPDLAVYSDQDRDVQPPKMLSPELPRSTIALWTTRTNAMELIVSEDGIVERVKLLTPPQRMPDMMILSRAKVWKFEPALKDGRPVRYRLVVKWEVNP